MLASAGIAVLSHQTASASVPWRPSQPITIYQPFPAGGTTDVHMRFLAERVSKKFGQTVNVVPKPGAAGTLAAAQLTSAKPDGYSLAVITTNSLHYPHYQKTTWHPLESFTYVIGLGDFVMGIVVPTSSPWKDIGSFIEAGKREPGRYTYGTSGLGGGGHLVGIAIGQKTGAKFELIPYKGSAEWLLALLNGEVNAVIASGFWTDAVDNGRARVLAFATEARYAKYPNVPTLSESGVPVELINPYGLVGPSGMPDNIINTLHDAFRSATDDPEYLPLLGRFGVAPWHRSPADFRAYFTKHFGEVRPLLVQSGLVKD